jgi:hypothetical protein
MLAVIYVSRARPEGTARYEGMKIEGAKANRRSHQSRQASIDAAISKILNFFFG